jgi:hypothetical protein
MPCAFATTSNAARGAEGRRDVTGISEMVHEVSAAAACSSSVANRGGVVKAE